MRVTRRVACVILSASVAVMGRSLPEPTEAAVVTGRPGTGLPPTGSAGISPQTWVAPAPEAPRVDGRLDEAVWDVVPPVVLSKLAARGNTCYATLLDVVTGGVNPASNGGHSSVLPNHLRHLVWWNFRNTGPARAESDFWNSSRLCRPYYVKPILAGLHGNLVTFMGGDKQLQLNESPGTKVLPESLYEAQLRLRIGSLPDWLIELKRTRAIGKQK